MNRLGDHRYIGHYLQMMIEAAAERPSLSVQWFTHPEAPMLHMFFARGALHAHCLLRCSERRREQTVRQLFMESGVTLVQDEVVGETSDQSCFLLYRLPTSGSGATRLVEGFFRSGYGLNDDTELEFTYRDRKST